MALRNIWDQAQNQFVVSSIDIDTLEIDNIPFNPSGTGGTQGLSSVLTVSNDGGNLNMTNVKPPVPAPPLI